MNKSRLGFFVFVILAGCTLGFVTSRFLREEIIVDHCLSAKHGSFDYAKMSCDLEENHIYIPYRIRHPNDKRITIVSLVTLATLALGYRFLRFGS